MRKRRLRLGVALAAAAALAVSASSAVSAESDPTVVQPGAALDALEQLSGQIMVELAGEPSAVAYAEARGRGASEAQAGQAAKARKAQNEQAQAAVKAAIAREGIAATPLYDVQTAYNGIAVQADVGAAADLAALPGVKAVHAIPLMELDNAYTVPLIGAIQAWEDHGGTGEGVSIAVIDTGVDYVHTGFGGSGSDADYMIARSPGANPPGADPHAGGFTVIGAGGDQIYPSAKVVGGWDFVGDNYSASPVAGVPTSPVAAPDPNPMDCNGHGTHVAGSAAGYGVNDDGSTYTGPWDASTDTSFDAMHIGPGVAPQAEVYALRVFGCVGDTAFTIPAIEWAVDPNGDGDPSDRVDVINMSLGSPFGTPDDPSAAAAENAAEAGVLVVASAGNNTDVYYVTGSPGSSTRTLTVASSADQVDTGETIRVNAPAAIAGDYYGSKSVSFDWNAVPSVTGNVYYPAVNQYGCSPWTGDNADPNIAGRILLIDWKKPGDATFPCGSAVRANNATAAGAIGIIMVDNVPFNDVLIAGNASTPAMVTTSSVGDVIKSQLTAGALSPVDATLDSTTYSQAITPGRDDTISGFTSRGPRTRDTGLKPDISAPGQSIWSVGVLSGDRGASLSGTSMAAPHMAGVMALLLENRPSWSVEELKALAMNTAAHDLWTGFNQSGERYGMGRVGAGRVNVANALAGHSIAYNADGSGSVSVSFGDVEVAGTLTETRTIRVANHGSSAQTYTIGFDERLSIPGVSFSFPDGTSLSVAAGGSETFRVQLNADASVMQNTRDATVAGVQGGSPRHWLSEAGGLAIVTPASGPSLRVPVYAAARPASATKAAPPFLNITPGRAPSGTINIAGEGVNTGPEPLGYVSKVSAFELQHTSGLAELADGVSEFARNGDIQHVGVTTMLLPGADPDAPPVPTLHWGISTHGDWSPAATDNTLIVQVDRDGDGTPDWQGLNTRFTDTDVFVFAGQSLSPVTGVGSRGLTFTNIFNSNVNTAPFNNNVIVFTIPAAVLELPGGQTSFRYRVIGQSRFWGTIDVTPWLDYDHAKPGLSFSEGLGGRPMYPALAGQKIGVTYDAANFQANGSQGVLLLHHFNEQGKRAEVLEVRTPGRR